MGYQMLIYVDTLHVHIDNTPKYITHLYITQTDRYIRTTLTYIAHIHTHIYHKYIYIYTTPDIFYKHMCIVYLNTIPMTYESLRTKC